MNIRKEIYGDGMDSFRNESHDFAFIYTAGEDNAISTYQNMKEWMECMKNLSLELLLKNKNLPKKNIKQLRNIIDTKSS